MFKEYSCRRVASLFGFLFIMLCWMMILISSVKAAEPIGKFSQIEGIVDVLRGGALPAIPVRVGDSVFEKDIIRTKSNSRAEIIFIDGNTIKISQRSRIDISEYLAEENKSNEILKLQRGKVEAMVLEKNVKRISVSPSAHKFEIHTPCAVTGVRGSWYSTYQWDNCTTIVVYKGIVYVFNPKFPDKIVEVHAGQMTRACEDSPPFEPIDTTNLMDLIIMGSPSDPGLNIEPPVTEFFPELLRPRKRTITED